MSTTLILTLSPTVVLARGITLIPHTNPFTANALGSMQRNSA